MNNFGAATPIAGFLYRVGAVLRRIIGAPDYDRYVRHVRLAHPGEAPLPAAEFYRTQLEGKYSRPGSRCC